MSRLPRGFFSLDTFTFERRMRGWSIIVSWGGRGRLQLIVFPFWKLRPKIRRFKHAKAKQSAAVARPGVR